MSWKGLFVSEPVRLSLHRSQLLLEQAGQSCTVPLEDIAFILLDSPQITLTSALLSACAETGCLLITTNARHLPNGNLLSFHSFHRQLETARLQISLSEPRKKRLWQKIIQRKISNQALCLRRLGLPDGERKLAPPGAEGGQRRPRQCGRPGRPPLLGQPRLSAQPRWRRPPEHSA